MSDLVPLGATDVKVSRLGVGVMTWGRGNRTYGGTGGAEDERAAFDACLANGINFFDSAEMYGSGSSETSLGAAARDRDAVIATKFKPLHLGAGSVPRALDGSLARLGRRTVDLYQIHWPVPWMSIPSLMDRLADAVDAGKVRAVGVSNYSAAQMRAAHEALASRGVPLASNQVQYSLLHREPEVDGVLQACRDLRVTLIAYMPLASGALTGKYSAQAKPPDRLRRTFVRDFRGDHMDAVMPVVARLREIGERHGRSPAQVALRWLMEHDGVVPIPGAKDARQAAENAGALTFSLTEGEVAALSGATQARRK